MCYVAPLRAAVLHLGADGGSFSVEQLRASARVTMGRAEAYATRLVGESVLRVNRLGNLVRSTGWQEWEAKKPRTRPGGMSRRYLAQKAARDNRPIATQVVALCVRALRGDRGPFDIARRCGIGYKHLYRIERAQRTPSPRVERRLFRVLNGQA